MSTFVPNEKHKSLFVNLITCVACIQPMKIERAGPDPKGRVLVQYRCESCNHVERIGIRRKVLETGDRADVARFAGDESRPVSPYKREPAAVVKVHSS